MRFLKLFTAINFCLVFFAGNIIAQKDAEVADKIYKDFGYKRSIPMYQNKSKMSVADMARVANSYRLNHDTENAELWYSQFIAETKDPQHYLNYAQMLQSNGRFDLAKKYYLEYDNMVGAAEGSDKRGKLLAEAVDRMKDFKHTEIQIKNESLINTGKLDFSPAYYEDGVIFVTTRGAQNSEEDDKDIWIDDNFMALFYATVNENGDLDNAKELSFDLTTRYHEGPVVLSKDGNKIFFTRNDFVNKKRRNASDGTMRLQIYSAFKQGDTWSPPVELPFNTVEYEEAHPALSPDGRKLYFSSDRPGGFGGMDLYVSNFVNGNWGKPENLGETINTAGNEVFPWIHGDGTMYYASNGWGGLGGLDIFSTNPKADGTWTKIENVGTPFNSKMDDFALIMNVLKTEGYLTSARRSGNGQDDIYSFKMPTNLPVKVQVCAYEEGTDTRLSDVEFEIVEQFQDGATASIDDNMMMTLEKTTEGNDYILKFKDRGIDVNDDDVLKVYNTDNTGAFEAFMKPDRKYLLVATKNGYTVGKEEFNGEVLKGKSFYEFCVPLAKMNCMNLDGVVKHKRYGNTIPRATVTLTNLCTGDDVVVTADEKGEFLFPCIDCGCEFVFKGEKSNFIPGGSKQNTIGDNCRMGETIHTEILLDNNIEELELTFAGVKIKEGAVIELENIYYDFDKFYIRDDAKDELNHVVNLMKIYPSMIIELGSHTDARATDQYNETLSANRAKAAVNYIVSQGIDRGRLVARGYGETTLKNDCANFVDCTEDQHQRNRRTEVKVIKFDNKDVDVKHLDNMPETIDPANPTRKFVWD